MKSADGLSIETFRTRDEMTRWIRSTSATEAGAWIRFAKKGSGRTSISYDEAIEVALCHGWIDGQKRRYDEDWYVLRFTPRRARSRWSAINRRKAEALIASGAMEAAGLAAVEAARSDGRWDAAYPSQSRMVVPPDLHAALELEPATHRFFEGLSSANRYAVLYRLHHAGDGDRRSETLHRMLSMLRERRTIHAPARRPVKKAVKKSARRT